MPGRRLGVSVPLEGMPVGDTVVPLARAAEEAGYTDAWSAEAGGVDAFSPLSAIAATCPSLRLGTAIVPVFTRPPALIAMSAASVQLISSGRFVLGVGTSSSIIVGRWMGIPFETPYTRMRETVAALREALSGKKLTMQAGTFSVEGFRLGTDEVPHVPIYMAALGPRMLKLAGEVADGVVLWLFSPEGARDAIAQVHDSARAAGRDPDAIDVVARIVVAIDEDPEFLRYMMRRMTTSYAMVDVYNASLRRQGFSKEADAIAAAWAAGERDKAAESVSDEMMSELYIMGDQDQCVARMQDFRDAGVTTPVVFPVSVAGDPSERLERAYNVVRAMAEA